MLKKIGLIDNLTIELSISRTDFINTLGSNLDKPQSDFFDIFSRSKNLYKGTVTSDSFELRRRRNFFQGNRMNWTKSSGKFRQKGDKVIVDIEFNGFHYMMIPFMIFGAIIYVGVIIAILTGKIEGNLSVLAIPFVLIHALFMFGIPYFVMRRSLRSAKYDIERDIYFLMRDKLNAPQQR